MTQCAESPVCEDGVAKANLTRQETQMTAISPLRQRMIEDMTIRNLAPATQRCYIHAVAKFSRYFRRSPDHLGVEEVRAYQMHLVAQKYSWQHINQTTCGLRFFYGVTLDRPEAYTRIIVAKEPQKLPVILEGEEIERFLAAVTPLRNRVALATAYASGLRIGEAARLKIGSIDSKRMLLRIENGKGGKDRYAMLSPRLLEILRAYWLQARPSSWLFPGQKPDTHVTGGAVQAACRLARERARIGKRVTSHALRHSFATHLLDSGTDIRVIQVLLGHAHLNTTARYVQVGTRLIAVTPSPIDQLSVAAMKLPRTAMMPAQ
jgi:integrase/recombinase XerD